MRSEKLRIAQVASLWTSIPPAGYGGVELLIHLMVEEMIRRGHEVTLFASADSKTSAKLHPVCERNSIEMMARGEAYCYEYYATAALAEAMRRADDFDVIHCHAGLSLVSLSVASKTPIVHTAHTAIGPDDQWLFRHYPEAPVVGVSHSQLSVVAEEYRRNLRVVHNACDFDAYDLAKPQGDYLVFLGRMGGHKNPVDAIKIARAVGMPIILAGRPQSGGEERYFAEEVRPLINDKDVKYIGPVNLAQKRDLFRDAAAFLFPTSWAEPCAVAPLEALAAGLPVLAYNNGSVSEVIDYGVTGFYADSVETLVPLVPEALKLDRAAIREHACKRFSHHRLVDEYLDVYRALIERH